MATLSYHIEVKEFIIREPTEEQIRERILALDNEDYSGVKVGTGKGTLTITGGKEGRVAVKRIKMSERTVGLVDTSILDNTEEMIELSILYQESNHYLRFTVPKSLAVESAICFVKNEVLLPEATWVESGTGRLLLGSEINKQQL